MTRRPRFEIIFDDGVEAHFAAIDRQDRALVLDVIEAQLLHEPVTPTRNRKPLRIPNAIGASWELRCGIGNRYRVFYDVDIDAQWVVVLALGRKIGSRLYIGDEEFDL